MNNHMPNLSDYIPTRVTVASARIATGRCLGQADLFAKTQDLASDVRSVWHADGRRPDALFTLGNGLTVTVDTGLVRPAVFQSFLLALADRFGDSAAPVGGAAVIDGESALAAVAGERDEAFVTGARQAWDRIRSGGTLEPIEAATVPKLYGSKARMTDLIWSAASAVLPDGTAVLDLMAGTGCVTRVLSRRFDLWANDANGYAAVLARAQTLNFADAGRALRTRLRAAADENADRLMDMARDAVLEEEGFLNDEFNEENRVRYVTFCATPAVAPRGDQPGYEEPYQLCLRGYANVYLGVAQCIDADSIRKAIEIETAEGSDLRSLCLAALLAAVSVCNSGPHFAQPRNLNSVVAFKHVAERRARSVRFEFERMLDHLAERPPSRRAATTTSLDWPSALRQFALETTSVCSRAIYVDPPYSKLQYSRYYHLLNTLVSYDYPTLSLTGRYPPVGQRFSSRFENNAGTARKEFDRLFEACADINATIMLSYSDTGFVPIDDLVQMMRGRYARVELLSENVRHHSQGKPNSRLSAVTEFVLIGRDRVGG